MQKTGSMSIRAVALLGHGGAGKTSLAEALLFKTGAIGSMGSLEKGTTVCDFDPLEKSHQRSLTSAVTHFCHGTTRVHLIDTPGYPDFVGHAIAAVPAADVSVIVVNAQNGIEMMTDRMMEIAQKRNVCRMIVVNKIDAENVDLAAVLASIQEVFGKECIPVNLPADGGKKVVDCFFAETGESDLGSVAKAHGALVDQAVEVDEALMTRYLDAGTVTPEEVLPVFKKAMREGHLIPVCFASARTLAGIPELLDVFTRLLPSQAEANPASFRRGTGKDTPEIQAVPDGTKHVLAHVFKVTIDPFVGKLGLFRVHQGTLTKDMQLFIGDSRKKFKVGHLFFVQGKTTTETDAAGPGDICAVAKVDDIQFDAILHDAPDDDHTLVKPMDFPVPIFGVSVLPKKRGDEQRLADTIHKLEVEDPCFKVERNAATNETIMKGLGDLHMRCVIEKMAAQYHLEVDIKPPRIAYRETVIANADGHHRHKKQTGGAGQFGEVYLRVSPLPRGTGNQFVDETVGGSIPKQFIPAVEKGVKMAYEHGVIAGYPMHDILVEVTDGKFHAVDSKEIAFVTAGRRAFQDAVMKATPMILEPIVHIEVIVPEKNMGDITGDLSSKRGKVSGTESMRGGMLAITGTVPLAEVMSYQSRLNSVTGGHGSYSISLSHYDPVPPFIQQQLVSQHVQVKEEE